MPKFVWAMLAGAIAATGAVACSEGKDASGPSLGCYLSADADPYNEQCTEMKNIPPVSVAGTKSICMSGGGELVTECPTAGLVGCCLDQFDPTGPETCYYVGYTSSQETPATLEAQCKAGGYLWNHSP